MATETPTERLIRELEAADERATNARTNSLKDYWQGVANGYLGALLITDPARWRSYSVNRADRAVERYRGVGP